MLALFEKLAVSGFLLFRGRPSINCIIVIEREREEGEPSIRTFRLFPVIRVSLVMPWVAACFDLLAAPLLGYCLAIRKLALQAGILQERRSDLVEKQTSNTGAISNTDAATMVPNAEERQGKVTLDVKGIYCDNVM